MGGDAIRILSSSVSSVTAPTSRLEGKLRRQYNMVSEQASHSLHFLHCPKPTAVIHPSLCFLSPKPTCYTAACLFSFIKKFIAGAGAGSSPPARCGMGLFPLSPGSRPPCPHRAETACSINFKGRRGSASLFQPWQVFA